MIFAVSMLFVDQTIVAIATGVMGVCFVVAVRRLERGVPAGLPPRRRSSSARRRAGRRVSAWRAHARSSRFMIEG